MDGCRGKRCTAKVVEERRRRLSRDENRLGRVGRLKIFLGAAPGVGKTYTMLRYAKSLKEQGIDVVVGYPEWHHREKTAAELDGLEVIHALPVVFQGRTFSEVNVAAIIERRPEVVVIDELAHANVQGSFHAKRYQDVEEILDAGIDVLTAVNVQHLASAYREAEAIMGIAVREVVPVSLLERAEMQMVDVTPQALRHRLKDGEIYPMAQVEAALSHFFRYDNLSALRQLALREVAQDVDQRLQRSYDREKIRGPVGARENVLVCVDFLDRAEKLVMKAARMSARMKADLIVLTVSDAPGTDWEGALSSAEEAKRKAFQQLADQYHGIFVVEERKQRPLGAVILEAANRYNVTQVVIGQPKPGRRWRSPWNEHPAAYLLRNLRYVDLRIVGWRD